MCSFSIFRSRTGHTASHLRLVFARTARVIEHIIDKETRHCHRYADQAQIEVPRDDQLREDKRTVSLYIYTYI